MARLGVYLSADELRYLTFLTNALPVNELGRKLGLTDPDVPSTIAARLLSEYEQAQKHFLFDAGVLPDMPSGYLGLVVDNTEMMEG